MISFFKERDFLNNKCSTKEKEDEKTDQKKNSKRSSFFFKESHISFARKNTTLFARHYKKTLKDGRYASFHSFFVLSISRFLSFNICFASRFSRDDLRKCPFLNIFSLYEESYE